MMKQELECLAGSRIDFAPMAQGYDRWYESSDGQAHDAAQRQGVTRLLPAARIGQSLLDVGCGTGHWTAFFRSMGYEVQGVDISPEMVEVARESVPEGVFQMADAVQLPFAADAFDVVAAMATLEFTYDPRRVVKEMVRCTRRGGRVLVGTLNRFAPLNRRRLNEGKEPYASARLYSIDDLCRLLGSWGRVRLTTCCPDQPDAPVSECLPDRTDPLRGQPQGAFIVAELSV